MPLLKNQTTTSEIYGRYSLKPDEWCLIPFDIAQNYGLDGDNRFRPVPMGGTESTNWDVVIFSGCNIDTTGGGQHPSQIGKTLASAGHRVLFVQLASSKVEIENLYVFQDRWLFKPAIANDDNKADYRELLNGFTGEIGRPKLALFTFPSAYLVGIIPVAKEAGYKTCYWCLDDWKSINEAAGNHKWKQSYEDRLASQVDYLIATANVLAGKLESRTGTECRVISNGFSVDNFPQTNLNPKIPSDMRIGDLTLVYWGELQGKWIDWDLITQVAITNPNWQINLIGPHEQIPDPPQLANIHYLGEKPVDQLWTYGFHADAGIIPFKLDDLSKAVNPIKAYEYLACNLWVIGPDMPELYKFPKTLIYNNTDEFINLASKTKIERHNNSILVAGFLEQSTWNNRVETFLEYVGNDT